MSFRDIGIGGVVGLVCAAVLWGLLAGGCNKNPDGPEDDCPDGGPATWSDPSSELLNNPVYSPIDSCIYYEDTGVDSACLEGFKWDPDTYWGCPSVVQPGIYRLHLNSDDTAELVIPWGCDPNISPDGSTMYYHPGSWGGPIMTVQLPDGEPELVREGCFIRACWYSPDTLVVSMCDYHEYFLDLRNDSLHKILINGGYVDVSGDQRICTSGARCDDSACIGIYDSTGIWYLGPLGYDIRAGRWAPDGEEIVFYDLPRSGGSNISVSDLEGNQRILAIGGGPYDLTIGGVFEPDFTSDGQFVIYIWHTTPLDYDPCRPRGTENLVRDGQIWIMAAVDGSDKRQVTTWSRIRP